jgi:nitrile hydratase
MAPVRAVHDIGGDRDHFGAIRPEGRPEGRPEANEPVFHAPWEGRVQGIALLVSAVTGRNVDEWRYTLEQLAPDKYFAGYYQRWLAGLESRLLRLGILAPGEIDARVAGRAPTARGERTVGGLRVALWTRLFLMALRPPPRSRLVLAVLRRVQGSGRRAERPPRFEIGQRVVVTSEPPVGHTRRPAYVRGRRGTIRLAHGPQVFADRHAEDGVEIAQHLYTVAFDGRELWGDGAEPNTTVCVDLFESYLAEDS